MRRGDITPTFAFCLSLLVHGGLAVALVRQYARTAIFLPGAPREHVEVTVAPPDNSELGEAIGHGDAPNALQAELPNLGRKAPHAQAFISRDPVGPGRVGDDPTMNIIPPGDEGSLGAQDSTPATPVRILPPVSNSIEPFGHHLPTPQLATARQLPHPGMPGPRAPAADPAPMTDSESDAFSPTVDVEIRAGSVEPKLGRHVKTIRPHLSLAAQIDLLGMQYPKMRLRVRLEPDGKVAKVDIVQSSHSETADQEVKVAVYQWQFEPRPKPGQADIVEFEINWR